MSSARLSFGAMTPRYEDRRLNGPIILDFRKIAFPPIKRSRVLLRK